MSRVYGKQLTLDVGQQVIHIVNAFNLLPPFRQSGALYYPLAERLNHYLQWILMLLKRYNAINRRIWECNVMICQLPRCFIESRVYMFFQLGTSAYRILTGNNVQG
ncbi:hypothetical protein D3C75_1061260 [compost metagenome]